MELKKDKRRQALKIVAVTGIISALMKAEIILAATSWGAPSKPGGVPTDLDQAILNATNWLLGFVGMIAVLVIIWGGINYLGSVGDEDRIRTAKNTIKWGLMGVIIAGFAYAIVNVIVTTILV